jgi:hypothetical protein
MPTSELAVTIIPESPVLEEGVLVENPYHFVC